METFKPRQATALPDVKSCATYDRRGSADRWGDGLRKYFWPFLLFLGVPLVGRVVINAYLGLLVSGLISLDSVLLPSALSSVTTTVLLGVLYPLVRNVDQATLRLVWTCTLVIAAMSTLVYLGAVFAGAGDSVLQADLVLTVGGLLSLPPLLWFARQASRFSLAHAFFLVLVIGGLTLPGPPESVPVYFRWLWVFADGVIAVWLLANFDLRGPGFRRWSVVVIAALKGLALLSSLVLVASGAAYAALLLLGIVVFFLLQLFLVYIVRVRHPTAQVPPVLSGENPGRS